MLLTGVMAIALGAPGAVRAQLSGAAPEPMAAGRVTRGEDGRVRIARGLALPTEGVTTRERVTSFLRRYGERFDIDDLDLVLDDVRHTRNHTIAVLRRRVGAERVNRRSVRLRFDRRGVVDLLVSDPGSREVSNLPRRVDARTVRVRAEAGVPFHAARTRVERARLDVGGRIEAGFVAQVDGARPTERAELLFDGRGRLLAAGSRVAHALGRVFLPNPVVAMDETSDVELPNLTRADRLTGQYIRAASCPTSGPCDPLQRAVADASGNFLYEPSDPAYDDAFSEVSAYYHSDRIAAYFRDVHGFVWSCCDTSTVLDVVANYTEAPLRPYDNASYSPSACPASGPECGSVVLGQGPLRDYAYDGDVVYHEYTHAVVDSLANILGFDFDDLGVSYEPGAINEGTSDYFSATLSGDATVAEYFSGSGALGTAGALRDLDNDLRCPDDLFGEAHRDGRIWGATGWALRVQLGKGKADALMYATLAVMVDNTDFDQAASLLMATAETLKSDGLLTAEDVSAVDAEVAARGLEGCRRIVPLDDGAEHLGYSGTTFATGTIGGQVAPTYYSIAIPADATRLTLDVVPATPNGEHTIFLRDGRSLRFSGVSLVGDAEIPVDPELRAITLTLADDPHPLPRCQTLYIGLRTDDLDATGQSVYSIRATLETSGDAGAMCPDPPPPDASVDATTDADSGADAGDDAATSTLRLGGGGCRCEASGESMAPPFVWLAAALWFVRGRRRRG